MKAKKQLLLSTNRFLTHPAILRSCFQGKTLLSAYRNDRVKKTYQFSLGKRTLSTKHQYLIDSYFMKKKSRIFSPKFPEV